MTSGKGEYFPRQETLADMKQALSVAGAVLPTLDAGNAKLSQDQLTSDAGG
jgi:hypothetical protein